MAAVLILLTGAIVLPEPAGSAFTDTTSNGASTFTAAATFGPEGGLYLWGTNTDGQLGLGDTVSPRTSPVQLGTDVTWTGLTLGRWHTCATRSDATLWCWGRNADGQLGRGDTVSPATSPVQVAGTTWRNVAAGDAFTCAVKTDNTLWCWGRNADGQLGQGDTVTPATSPVQVGTDTTWSAVAASSHYTCAVKTAGTLWCWGFNDAGELGQGNVVSPVTSPVQVGAGTTWRSVTTGSSHTCATRSDDTLFCWGSNFDGQLGRGNTVDPEPNPVQVTGTTWRSVTAGPWHNCALKADHTLWCWGYNFSGQLGRGDTVTPATSPVQIGALTTWEAVATSGGRSGSSGAIR